ncbi:hypothetical protein [Pseudomonas nicosulfuronedens]
MANTHTKSPTHQESGCFVPLGTDSQHHANPRNATLYLRTDAPADELYNAAEDRLSAVIDLLGILSLSTLDAQPLRNVLQINRALLLLASDAHSLYQADHERRGCQP